MNAFDKVVGYEAIKEEFQQILDMIANPHVYRELGAKLPHGILLVGRPGTGKTTICSAFMEEAGLPSIILRKNSSDGNFVRKITDAFEQAKKDCPCVLLLDDLDKFSNQDEEHCDAEEYVAVQAGIDSVKNSDGVLVLATVNNLRKLPSSLIRAGRFDRQIKLTTPSDIDAAKILDYYLANKKVDPHIDKMDIVKMAGGNVAAVLESLLNDAAIMAAAERCNCIRMKHITAAILRKEYNCIDDTNTITDEELQQRAIHESGHITIALALKEEVGFASVIDTENNDAGGFVHMSKKVSRRPHDVLIAMGGKAACELRLPRIASGCSADLDKAGRLLKNGMANNGTHGFNLLDADFFGDSADASRDAVVKAELNRYYQLARTAIIENKELLDDICDALLQKHTLLYSDISKIAMKHEIHYAVV